ncbi:acyltransferase family protein [Streptococcus pluranimalium]|uniref:acyltransferase family protein n=1 Tax=Streptococcus pluranimalium TaxID=82348 RepID=UPI003F68ED8B
MRKEKIKSIDIAKGLGIILVVLGHSFPDALSKGGIENPIFRFLESFIYSFHMPLFFFVSGFLAVKVVYGKESINLFKKINRLLIPYSTMSIIYLILRFFASNLATSSYNLSDFWKIFLGISPNGGVWFLYVLCLSLVFTYLFVSDKNLIFWLIVFAICCIVSRSAIFVPGYSVLKYFTYNYVFYLLGIFCHRNRVFEKYNLKKLAFVFYSIFLLGFVVYYFFGFSLLAFPIAVFGVLSILALAQVIDMKEDRYLKNGLLYLGRMSMYIYLLHGPILVIVRYIFWDYLGLTSVIVTPIMFVLGLVGAIVITEYIVKKVYIFNALLTGNIKKIGKETID